MIVLGQFDPTKWDYFLLLVFHIPESISCSYWDRWGVLSDCKILAKNGNNLLGAKDFTAKRLGVLFDIENGWHALVADYDSLLSYIDGIGFSKKN